MFILENSFKKTPFLWLALLGLLWGANFIFMKIGAAVLSSSQIVWLRLAFGAFVLSPFLPIVIRVIGTNRKLLFHVSVMALSANVLTFHCFMEGTKRLDSGAAGVLSGTVPLLTTILAALVLPEEKLSRQKTAGILTSFIGIIFIVNPWNGLSSSTMSGVGYMLLGGIGYAVAFVYARKNLVNSGVPSLSLAALQMLLATIFYTPLTHWAGMGAITDSWTIAASVAIGLGVLGSGFAYVIYYGLIQSIGAVATSSVSYLPPVVALCLGIIFLGESIGIEQMAGCMLVLGGIFLVRNSLRK
ncbi:DMT family transporter [Desulfovibrio gilichinskyi]|uniref:Threonine/homoserine efflux transporter RhtA n=1 Tax=Desulfovibrio gilichinskyi TaxID=1519643 RepID=A0A1X7CYM7_9BACT|nr:DMT family transporter [Desulfovibrio gilichinskyi]SMF05436.1 Threonine/homoserine efflux transporter RhtA [Desulfovibrio gilichinskyi]